MLNPKEFDEYVLDKCKNYLQDYDEDVEFEFKEIKKINGPYRSLAIKFSELNAEPQINMDDLYFDYLCGSSLEKITQGLENMIDDVVAKEDYITHSLTLITDYNKAKERLFIRVCDQKKNEDYLKEKVNTPLHALACTYSVYSTMDEEGISSCQVTNRMLEEWGITKEQLHEDALKNMQHILPPSLFSLSNVVANIMGDEPAVDHLTNDEPLESDMYCLSNSRKLNGASYVCDEKLMEYIAERIGESFFVLPSSQHEVILVPESLGRTGEELQEIVRCVNETQVIESDYLSDDIMCYDIEERKLLPVIVKEQKETKTMENDYSVKNRKLGFSL